MNDRLELESLNQAGAERTGRNAALLAEHLAAMGADPLVSVDAEGALRAVMGFIFQHPGQLDLLDICDAIGNVLPEQPSGRWDQPPSRGSSR